MIFESTEDYDKLISGGFEHMDTESTPEAEQFVPVSFNRIRDREWRMRYRNPFVGYLYIRSQVVRASYDGDKYDLFNRYWRDNKMAAAPSYRNISKAFGYKDGDTKQPRKWVKQLFQEGAFVIDQIDVGKPEPANIYILGYNEQGKEIWYYDRP